MPDDVVDFRDLLNQPMSDFPDMPDLPAQKTFYGKLLGLTADVSKNKGTPFFHFDARITDPGKDVDPAFLTKLSESGFSLADYTIGANFYLTPRAMTMLRRFVVSLGFSAGVSFAEALKLDPDTGNPTPQTAEVVRGLDIMIKTPPMQENGRVYTQNVSSDGMIMGVKRDA